MPSIARYVDLTSVGKELLGINEYSVYVPIINMLTLWRNRFLKVSAPVPIFLEDAEHARECCLLDQL